MFISPDEIDAAEWFVHRVDVSRSTAAGTDASGNPVEAWTKPYTALACFVAPGSVEDVAEWEQVGVDASHRAYFPPVESGGLPQLTVRDVLNFGARNLLVVGDVDEGEAGVVLTVTAKELRRGETS